MTCASPLGPSGCLKVVKAVEVEKNLWDQTVPESLTPEGGLNVYASRDESSRKSNYFSKSPPLQSMT